MTLGFINGHFVEFKFDENGVYLTLSDDDSNILDEAYYTPPSMWNKAEDIKKEIDKYL